MSGPTLRSVGLECQGAPTSRASEHLGPSSTRVGMLARPPCFRESPTRARASPAQPGGRFGRGAKPPPSLEQLLHDQHIDPPPVEQALLAVDPDLREAHPLVER